jgi:hypothetical protein
MPATIVAINGVHSENRVFGRFWAGPSVKPTRSQERICENNVLLSKWGSA